MFGKTSYGLGRLVIISSANILSLYFVIFLVKLVLLVQNWINLFTFQMYPYFSWYARRTSEIIVTVRSYLSALILPCARHMRRVICRSKTTKILNPNRYWPGLWKTGADKNFMLLNLSPHPSYSVWLSELPIQNDWKSPELHFGSVIPKDFRLLLRCFVNLINEKVACWYNAG